MRIIGFVLAASLSSATCAIAQEVQHVPAPPLAKPLQPIGREHWITDADFPDLARRQGMHGTTVYRLDIDNTGKVTNCTIVRSSGSSCWTGRHAD